MNYFTREITSEVFFSFFFVFNNTVPMCSNAFIYVLGCRVEKISLNDNDELVAQSRPSTV